MKTEAINKRMLDKWDYSYNQNLPYQKSFAWNKLWNKIETAYKPLHTSIYYVHNYWLFDVFSSICSSFRNEVKGQMFWNFLSTY